MLQLLSRVLVSLLISPKQETAAVLALCVCAFGNMSADTEQVHEKGAESDLSAALKELQEWKLKVKDAEELKTELMKRKKEEEEEKRRSQELMKEATRRHEEERRSLDPADVKADVELSRISRRNQESQQRLLRLRSELEQKKKETRALRNTVKVVAHLPHTPVEFLKPGADDDSADAPIRGQFCVSQQGALLLQGPQALMTFEDEKVASRVLQMDKCCVSFDGQTLEVKPQKIQTESHLQFQVDLCVSRSLLDVVGVVSAMPDELLEKCVALSFSGSRAEVTSVKMDHQRDAARVQLSQPVAEWLACGGGHTVELETTTKVHLAPVLEHQLSNFQTFCPSSKRSVLLLVSRDTGDEEEVQDQLEIYFQKPSNGGGEIETTTYLSPGRSELALLSPDR